MGLLSPITKEEADIIHNNNFFPNVKVGVDQPVQKLHNECNIKDVSPVIKIKKVNHKVPKQRFLKQFGKPVKNQLEDNVHVDSTPLGFIYINNNNCK